MGLGKTLAAIGALDRIGARQVLVITPAAVRIHIGREFARFSPGRPVQVIENGRTPVTGDLVIASYALARAPAVWRQLAARRWDALVIDEGQALRSPGAKQTRAIL